MASSQELSCGTLAQIGAQKSGIGCEFRRFPFELNAAAL
jgi:hypothetical protein